MILLIFTFQDGAEVPEMKNDDDEEEDCEAFDMEDFEESGLPDEQDKVHFYKNILIYFKICIWFV